MDTRPLGRTGVRISEVTLGTWGLASGAYAPTEEKHVERLVARAIDVGVRAFDMAPLWGDGHGERVVGHVAGQRRDDVRYITRGGIVSADGALLRRYDPESLERDLEGSLERLATDRIDVWLLHDPPEAVLRRDDWRERVERWKTAGKILSWGVSVGDQDRARMALAAGADALCMVYNLLESDDVHDLAAEIAVADACVLARSPLAYGLLSGSWHEEMRFPQRDQRARRWTPEQMRVRVRRVNELRFLVKGEVTSMAAAAIRYVLANRLVASAITGARTVPQLEEIARAADGPPFLPELDLARLGTAFEH